MGEKAVILVLWGQDFGEANVHTTAPQRTSFDLQGGTSWAPSPTEDRQDFDEAECRP